MILGSCVVTCMRWLNGEYSSSTYSTSTWHFTVLTASNGYTSETWTPAVKLHPVLPSAQHEYNECRDKCFMLWLPYWAERAKTRSIWQINTLQLMRWMLDLTLQITGRSFERGLITVLLVVCSSGLPVCLHWKRRTCISQDICIEQGEYYGTIGISRGFWVEWYVFYRTSQ